MGNQPLVLQLESNQGFSITIDHQASVIGRGADCDHTLDVKGVSRRHAQIRRTPESEWVVEDLGSTNGTYLNGSRITGPAVLKLTDVVTLGEANLQVVQIGAREQTVVVHDLTALRSRWTGDPSAETTQSLRESVTRLSDLVEISKALSACASIDTIFRQVREVVFRYFDSIERIALMVDLQGDGTLSMINSAMRSSSLEPGDDWISWSICRQAQREKAAIQTADTLADDRFEGVPSIMAKGIRTAMAVPLWDEDKVVGVFYADASRPTENWEDQAREELGFFSALGNLLAASLQRWLLTRKLQDEELFTSRLQRYHSPSVIEKILAGALEEESLAPQGFDITVMFADIVGFTTLSERLSPSAIARLLNAFFEEMLVEIFDQGGTLDKFIGDAIMAFFGAPKVQSDHADRCVRAALRMLSRLEELNRSGKLEIPLEIRVAVNSGNAVVGDVGSKQRVDYTALGATINLASRIEKFCPPGHCAISEATYSLLSSKAGWKSQGPQTFKGVERVIEVYLNESVDA